MRTSKSRVFFVFCIICLSCHVQQCNLLALGLMSTLTSSAASSAMTMSSAIGMSLLQSMLQSVASTMHLGITTVQTMALSLISGFMMGVLALSGFLFFLMTIIPAEEYRGIGASSPFKIPLSNRLPQLAHIHKQVLNATSEPLFLRNATLRNETEFGVPTSGRREKRSTLVNNTRIAKSSKDSKDISYSLESIARITNASDERIPRFLSRLVQRDPLNCLPLLMCGLSAARKPNERTEAVNDYAYLLREFILDDVADRDDKSENEDDDSSLEDDLYVTGKTRGKKRQSQLRSPMDFLSALASAQNRKKKDEVDKVIDEMHKDEEDKIEELVLTEMADDPHDLKFALEDMKVRGLRKTMAQMPQESRKKYIQKLMNDESPEEDEEGEEGLEMGEDSGMTGPMKWNNARYEYPGSSNYEDYNGGYQYYHAKDLTRGGYQPAPPVPPVPQYGGSQDSDEFFKRKLNVKKNKERPRQEPKNKNRILIATPMPPYQHSGRRRVKRDSIWSQRAPPRGFLQKKRGELLEAQNLYDRARIATEVGSVARSNRQCRAFFQGCDGLRRPASSAKKTSSSNKNTADDTEYSGSGGSGSGTPFLNRAVNNIRRVLLGPAPEASKAKRVSEIREVIQQLQPHPPSNHGGSEVRVVLNIGPSGAPQLISSSSSNGPGGIVQIPPQEYMQPSHAPPMPHIFPTPQELGLPPPFSTQLVPKKPYAVSKKPAPTTKRPLTTKKPTPRVTTTKKAMVYRNPASTSASKKPLPPLFSTPSAQLDTLTMLLKKTTLPPVDSNEEGTTIFPLEDTTLNPLVIFDDVKDSGEEQSVEEESVLPTRYPMSKEEYADNLRETFNIFNRFKEAHKNPPPPPTTAGTGVKQSTSLASVSTTRQTPTQNGNKNIQKLSASSTTATFISSSSRPDGGVKGETGDAAQGDVEDGEDGDRDIVAIWENIKDTINKITKKKKKKKAAKGKGKRRKKKPGKDESSEESSEEEFFYHPPKHPALVAVPHPYERRKIHWRSGTQLVTDKLYHLLFKQKLARPLPDDEVHGPVEFYPASSAGADYSHEVHYKKDSEEIHHAAPHYPGPIPNFHRDRWRTDIEKGEEDIPSTGAPPEKDAKPSPAAGRASGPVLLIAAPNPTTKATKPKKKQKESPKVLKPAQAPIPESVEDDEDEKVAPSSNEKNDSAEPPETSGEVDDAPSNESEEEYPIYPRTHSSSASGSSEDEEDAVDINNSESKPTRPQLVYNPFTVKTPKSRARLGLGAGARQGQSKKPKSSKGRREKLASPPVKIKFSDLYGNRNATAQKRSSLAQETMTGPTVKAKRKVLKYKNG